MTTKTESSFFLFRWAKGLWNALTFTRNLILNMIVLFLVVVMIVAIFSGGGTALKARTALVIAPEGAIVEQYSGNPADRALASALGDDPKETQLRDILHALDAAAKDSKIERVILKTDGVWEVGVATLQELRDAILKLRKSGKQVIAYGDAFEQKGYYLAAHADEVHLNPEGAILLEGLGRYRTYFKNAFDKYGIDAHLFRVGEYKSFGEPYIRSDQSPEAREADLYWMGDVWQSFISDIANARKLDPNAMLAGIEGIGASLNETKGDLAALALQQKLVDKLTTRDQFRALMIERGMKDDEEETFRQISLKDYLVQLQPADMARSMFAENKVAVVVAEGEITDGDQAGGTVGGDSTAQLIRDAREDESVKALVLRVDSPGGGVFPSELIRREVELTKKAGKPVMISMGDLAASGGYWISMNGDRIFARPTTITGSIGIFGLFMNIPKAYEKLGLNTDGVGTTWLAGAFDPTRELDPRVGEVIQSVINHGYDQFIGKVATSRKKTPEQINTVARGRVWSGSQALAHGLVDQLGGLQDAIDAAAKAAKIGSAYETVYVEKELEGFDKLIADMAGSAMARGIGKLSIKFNAELGMDLIPDAQQKEIVAMRNLVKSAASKKPIAMYARCDCGSL